MSLLKDVLSTPDITDSQSRPCKVQRWVLELNDEDRAVWREIAIRLKDGTLPMATTWRALRSDHGFTASVHSLERHSRGVCCCEAIS